VKNEILHIQKLFIVVVLE